MVSPSSSERCRAESDECCEARICDLEPDGLLISIGIELVLVRSRGAWSGRLQSVRRSISKSKFVQQRKSFLAWYTYVGYESHAYRAQASLFTANLRRVALVKRNYTVPRPSRNCNGQLQDVEAVIPRTVTSSCNNKGFVVVRCIHVCNYELRLWVPSTGESSMSLLTSAAACRMQDANVTSIPSWPLGR